MSGGRYKAYPEYKDSGVEWLGKLPSHWEARKLKFSCQVFPSNVDKKSHEGEMPVHLCNYTDVYYNETITADMDFMAATASSQQIAKFTLRAGDTIITKDSETADDIAIAAYVPLDLPGVVCGYHLSMVRPFAGFCGAFVKRLFDSTYAKSCFAVRANGLTRVGLGQYELDNVELPFPSLPEQKQIAAFLDHETAKIDRLIEKQQALISLLKEKRQAVISHAVTKGLNPHAPLKDSGIEWLGQVPAHWTPTQFKFLIRKIDQGKSPECEARLASLEEWGVLKSGCVNRGIFLEEEHKALPANIPPTPSAEIKEGDLLMSRASGSTDLIGSVGLVGNVRPRLMMSDKIFRLQPEATMLPKFIWRMTASTPVRKQIELSINGAEGLANNITKESIGRLVVTCPPFTEQKAIVDHLEIRCAQIDQLLSNAELQITLLQERRTALISAAVTGKIDVRHWQPPVVSNSETTAANKT